MKLTITKGKNVSKKNHYMVRKSFQRGKQIMQNVKRTNHCFSVQSETDPSKTYQVKFDESNEGFVCNCGVQFGVGERTSCKHIAAIIHRILKKFCEGNEAGMAEFASLFSKIKC